MPVARCKEGRNHSLSLFCVAELKKARVLMLRRKVHLDWDISVNEDNWCERKLNSPFKEFHFYRMLWSRTFYGRPNFVTYSVLFLTVGQIMWLKECKSVTSTILNTFGERPLAQVSVSNFIHVLHPFWWLHDPLFCYKFLCDLLKNVSSPWDLTTSSFFLSHRASI